MIRLLLSLSLAILIGCATPVAKPELSDDFGIYIRMFKEQALKRDYTPNLENLAIYYVDYFSPKFEQEMIIGMCGQYGERRVIYIRRPSWNSYDSLQKEMLMFHELGHCVLGLNHDRSTNEDGDPLSVMYPSNFDSTIYNDDYNRFLDRLFEDAKFKEMSKKTDGVGSVRENCAWGHTKSTRSK